MIDRSNIWDSFSFISNISNKTTLMVSMVGDNLDATIGKLHTVLTFHNTSSILGLGLGEMSTIGISTSILISKWLRCQLFLMVWGWVGSRVVRGRGGVVRSRSWVVGSGCRCVLWSAQGRANKE